MFLLLKRGSHSLTNSPGFAGWPLYLHQTMSLNCALVKDYRATVMYIAEYHWMLGWLSVRVASSRACRLTCIPCSFEITRLSVKSTLLPTSTTLTDSNAFYRAGWLHRTPVTTHAYAHTHKALQSSNIIAPSQKYETHFFDVSNPFCDITEGLLICNVIHQHNSLQWGRERHRQTLQCWAEVSQICLYCIVHR